MSLVSLPILAIVFSVGLTSLAIAAGGGGSAGGSGAQNQPANGLPPGEPGPPGSANNPHRTEPPPVAVNEAAKPATPASKQ